MKIQFNPKDKQTFTGRGVRNVGQLMNRLYESAYQKNLFDEIPDIIQISAKMKDGTEVSAIANFDNGHFLGIRFPFEHVQYKNEFCKTIIKKFNKVVTKGKSEK